MSRQIKNLTMAAIMATLIMMMTAYICHVPVGMNGGYIHFGDALIYLTAVLLPKPYAMAAAAIGGGMADLLTAPMWAPATVMIKMLIVIPFGAKGKKIVSARNIIATIIAYLISGFGYFLAEYLLFDTWAVLLVSLSQSMVQSLGSAIIFVALGLAFDKAGVKRRFFEPVLKN